MAASNPVEDLNVEGNGAKEAEQETGLCDKLKETGLCDKLKEKESPMDKEKIVSDSIFGFIPLKPYVIPIIDTIEFQRLRCIWQLGATPFVYPTANHTRFEHSIASYYIASRLISKIKKRIDKDIAKGVINEGDIFISDEDVKCVEIAALCHDMGRGPFSDVWENIIVPNIAGGNGVRINDRFKDIWAILKCYDKVKKMLSDEKLNEEHENIIIALVKGDSVIGKEILSNIVCNVESGMDVDEWESLARDCRNLGHSLTNYKIDIDRMIHFARAIKGKDENGKDEKWKIAFRASEILNMVRVYQLRHYLYQTAYQHKTVVAIETMLLDGFKKYLRENNMENQVGNYDWIMSHSDSLFWLNIKQIPEFERILKRQLYIPIYQAVNYKPHDDKTEEIKKYLIEKGCNLETVRFRFCKFKLLSTSANPILSIPFYKKGSPNEIFFYKENNIPVRFTVFESKLIVFSTVEGERHGDNERNIKTNLNDYFKKQNENATKEKERWIFPKTDE